MGVLPIVGAGNLVKEGTMFKFSGRLLICAVAIAASIASAAAPEVRQQHFPTPETAVEALIKANRDNSRSALLAILGADGTKLIHSGDPIEDRRGRTHFVAAYDAAHAIEPEGQDRAVLIVGEEQWPLPIPLIHEPNGWRFDTRAGKEEILNRRIGRNELKVIDICRSYVEAQREYAAMSNGGHGEFAREFRSAPGRHDGLYWPAQSGEPESPLGPLVAEARAGGYPVDQRGAKRSAPRPYYGYFFRILTAQGVNASGGAKSYVHAGHMTQGFALLAYPAIFGDSGVMTFIVNQSGIVFEKNLGPDTARVARGISVFDPDSSWHTP
jgi:hypothetical protein